jgi:hypothetical protein
VIVDVNAAWVVTALVAGVAVTYALTRSSPVAAAPAPGCPVDEKRFHDWGSAEGYTTVYLPSQAPPPPSIDELEKDFTGLKQLPPSTKVVVACQDGSLWYYENLAAKPVKRDDLRALYYSTQKGATAGDPASLFLV